jgi:hypothetical protein
LRVSGDFDYVRDGEEFWLGYAFNYYGIQSSLVDERMSQFKINSFGS